jgi:hypothetical protein
MSDEKLKTVFIGIVNKRSRSVKVKERKMIK